MKNEKSILANIYKDDRIRTTCKMELGYSIVHNRIKNAPPWWWDRMNEPFIGSDIDKVWEAMKTKFLEKTRLYNSLSRRFLEGIKTPRTGWEFQCLLENGEHLEGLKM